MSNRLNQEREAEQQPKRMKFAREQLTSRQLEITFEDKTEIRFLYNKNEIKLFPYSGWFQGKGLTPGRGVQHLLNQIDRIEKSKTIGSKLP